MDEIERFLRGCSTAERDKVIAHQAWGTISPRNNGESRSGFKGAPCCLVDVARDRFGAWMSETCSGPSAQLRAVLRATRPPRNCPLH